MRMLYRISGACLCLASVMLAGCNSKGSQEGGKKTTTRPVAPRSATRPSIRNLTTQQRELLRRRATSRPTSRPVPAGPHPRIHVDQPIFDMGSVWSTDPAVKHSFQVRNVGQRPLNIMGVFSSCGCTQVGRKSVTIEPGQSWDLVVELIPREQQPFVGHSVFVVSNDPVEPRYEVKIRGIVRVPVLLRPHNGMYFGTITAEETRRRELVVSNNTDQPMDLQLVRCEGTTFSAKLESLKAGKEYRLTIECKPPYKAGVNAGRIEMTTGIKQQPTLEVRPQTFLPPRVMWTPTTIMLSDSMPDGRLEVVSVRNNGTSELKLIRVTTTVSGITSRIEPVANGKVQNVRLRFPPNLKVPEGGGEVVIETNDAEFRELKVMIVPQMAEPVPAPPPAPAHSSRPASRPAGGSG